MDSANWYRTKADQLQAMARLASTKKGRSARSVYLTQLAERFEREASACDAFSGNKPGQRLQSE
jgi:hypothetical protein